MGCVVKKILVVDDDAVFLTLLERTLQELGTVVTAPSAEEALLTLRSTPIDLIVTDMHMGKMSGAELAKIVKTSRYRDTNVILQTGDYGVESAYADAILHKPVERDDLLNTARQLLFPPQNIA